MSQTHFRTCTLCEAMCGLALEVEDGSVVSIRGDADDPLSQGYLCPKAMGLKDIHEDPARLRRPLRRVGDRWEEIGWEEAYDYAAERLFEIQSKHGLDSVALYEGNPHSHNYSAKLMIIELARSLRTRSRYGATSMDHLPQLVASFQMFGNQLMLPIPDLDRTQFLLILGANPAVSNGSLMSAPDVMRRLKGIQARGGRVVVVDPRRTRTAELADAHHFIHPGTDALLLLAMIHTLFEEQRVAQGRLAEFTRGMEALAGAARSFTPEAVAGRVGIEAGAIRALARDFAASPTAVCYGRMGACTQEFGATTTWLIYALNTVTGNLDRAGGAMFARAAVDIVPVGVRIGLQGSLGRWGTRVRGLPEFTGELPAAALAEEIDTPGAGQIRALICSAGNVALSTPNGTRMERALPKLEFLISMDIYLNETARHAHLILPPPFSLERDHYDLAMNAIAIRNVTRYTSPLFDPGPDARHDWQTYLELAIRLDELRGDFRGWWGALRGRILRALTPRRLIDLFLLLGPYRGLSTRKLLKEQHTRDLGAHQPCLPARLYTPDKRIDVAPKVFMDDLARLQDRTTVKAPPDGLLLIGRRQVRTNNSWMHNVARLIKGRDSCTLLMHPEDARERGLADGDRVRVTSRVGTLIAPLEVTGDVMRGVVSLPHGFGHNREGTRLPVAAGNPGVSANDITDELHVDAVSGTAAFSGVPVTVLPAETALASGAA